jgi:hypothetical protein
MLPTFIDIGEVLSIPVIVADADWKGIAKGPLHLPAMDADRYRGMRRAVNELHCQRIDLPHIAAISTSKRRKRIEQNLPFARIHTDPNIIGHGDLLIPWRLILGQLSPGLNRLSRHGRACPGYPRLS